MKAVSITVHKGAKFEDAFKDVARSIREGYGAGTITSPNKDSNFEECDYIGFWTSQPSKEWTDLNLDTDTEYLIVSEKEVYDYEMARIVENYKP